MINYQAENIFILVINPLAYFKVLLSFLLVTLPRNTTTQHL